MILDIVFGTACVLALVAAIGSVVDYRSWNRNRGANQSNSVAGGDIVGGNLNIVSGRDTNVTGSGKNVRCAHCGALQ